MKPITTRILPGLSLVPKRAIPDKPLNLSSPVQPTPPAATIVRGNTLTKRYHRSGCEWGDKMAHPQIFPSPEEARSHGYKPCSACMTDGHKQVIR